MVDPVEVVDIDDDAGQIRPLTPRSFKLELELLNQISPIAQLGQGISVLHHLQSMVGLPKLLYELQQPEVRSDLVKNGTIDEWLCRAQQQNDLALGNSQAAPHAQQVLALRGCGGRDPDETAIIDSPLFGCGRSVQAKAPPVSAPGRTPAGPSLIGNDSGTLRPVCGRKAPPIGGRRGLHPDSASGQNQWRRHPLWNRATFGWMLPQVQALPDGGKLHIGKKGVVQSHWLGKGVLLHARSGVITDEFSALVQDECNQQLSMFGQCILMVDATLTKMHSTQFREDMTLWFQQHPSAEVHVLTKSSMVRMAVTVATIGGDGMHAYTYEDEAMWVAIGKRHVAKFRRMPLKSPKP